MATEIYEGPIAAARPETPYLSSEDLAAVPGRKVKATITSVERQTDVKMQDGRTAKEVYVLRFEGKTKGMVVSCRENRQALSLNFGPTFKDCIGKEIEIYVKDGVRQFGGGTGPGLRIRVQAPSTTLSDALQGQGGAA